MKKNKFEGQEKNIIQALMKKTGSGSLANEEKVKIWEEFKTYIPLKKEKGRKAAIRSMPEDSILKKLFSQVFGKNSEN